MEDAGSPDVSIPVAVRVHLSHPAIEVLALEAGVDLLHIKGPALLPGLRPPGRSSTDVDVLVAPGDVSRLEQALARHGWDRRSTYDTGSAFRHASNWFHGNWGYVDVHALWPGPRATPAEVYAEFAAGGLVQEIGHFPCRVPNRTAQILILVLHAARSIGSSSDLEVAWYGASDEDRAQARAMAQRLRAETAMAAGLGELDATDADRTADLWRYYAAGGGTRLDEWRARLRAADSRREWFRVLGDAVLVNRDYLRMELGHPPTTREVAVRQWQRVRVLGGEVAGAVRQRAGRRLRRGDR